MTPTDFLALSKEERNEVCAKVEGWTYEDAILTRNPDTFAYDMCFDYPDYSDPRNSSRLIARAIEEMPVKFGNHMQAITYPYGDDPRTPEMSLALASDDQRLACAVCALAHAEKG